MAQTNLLSLDVGMKRIGMAVIDSDVRIARPLGWLEVDGSEIAEIVKACGLYQPSVIVVGYPRNQSGEPTQQTRVVEEFCERLKTAEVPPIVFQDESLTSVVAEEQLKAVKKPYNKGDIDAVAAALILTDYVESH
ncbi:Holliday junction resolvase RuvX [Candidatus Saccharibacteria bacterium]|nr:MAG: Holliday junction resolvase RuvX [Candidatus Saccharibacteria bacterium]